MCVQTSVLVST